VGLEAKDVASCCREKNERLKEIGKGLGEWALVSGSTGLSRIK